MVKTKDQSGIAVRRVRSLIKSVMRQETHKAFAASRINLEYYDLGWRQGGESFLRDFELLVKEHGFD